MKDRLLYEDAELLVLNKPAGLAVHPGPRTPHSLEDHLDELRLGFRRAPVPVHRLDRDTSGCLVLARNPKAAKRLGALFAARQVTKLYAALLSGTHEGEGRIDMPLRKQSTKERGWWIETHADGKPAATHWRALQRAEGQTLAAFWPETGRTHQIRVHAAEALSPIVGDPVYGSGEKHSATRLHAWRIGFPWKHGQVDVTAPLRWPEFSNIQPPAR
ncbi:MAG: RNA pseudouridine synthase [Pacificimonas sp.]|nr:RNA pseudouridine synthase [Pacificimonas sp.]